MDRSPLFNSLIEKVADAKAPSRELFTEVWIGCAGSQHRDIQVLFATRLNDRAWREAALMTVACALPGWRIVSSNGRGYGEALLVPPDHAEMILDRPEGAVRHTGGASLAILVAMLQAAATEGTKVKGRP